MAQNEQPALFPQEPRESDRVAAGIVPPERPYADYDARKEAIIESRGEDLGKEQTGMPVELPVPVPEAKVPRKPFELPGKDGRSNYPRPTRSELLQGMSQEAREGQDAINKLGAAAARRILESKRK
jgi:hypothetical protein